MRIHVYLRTIPVHGFFMALYAIGDLHLSLSSDKPMDVFGGNWENYVDKIRDGFSSLREEDLCVICGDVSWATSLEGALEDFKFIDALPGRKLVLKGNHDYWWNTLTKIASFFKQNSINTIDILHNNCYFYDGFAICGTRGWFYEEETGQEHDRKIMNREIGRVAASLKLAGDNDKLCFFHYPPRFKDYVCTEITEILAQYKVRRCFYGHIHSTGHRFAVEGLYDGIEYRMVSADWINFKPYLVF